jgi:hypothetical protein
MTRKQKPIDWEKYPIRMCYTMHTCRLCGGKIRSYTGYYDGGYGRRAHLKCAKRQVLDDI